MSDFGSDGSRPSEKIWQSYVHHGGKCWFVSTIERDYDCQHGISRGPETLVWEWNVEKNERGELVGHMGGVRDHQQICRCLIAEGEMLDGNNPRHDRFLQ